MHVVNRGRRAVTIKASALQLHEVNLGRMLNHDCFVDPFPSISATDDLEYRGDLTSAALEPERVPGHGVGISPGGRYGRRFSGRLGMGEGVKRSVLGFGSRDHLHTHTHTDTTVF